MFKDTVSDKKKFWRYFIILLFSGFVLFIWSALFYTPFKDIATALDSKEGMSLSAWLVSGALGLLFGTFWMGFFIIFESAKKGIIDLIFKS